MTRGFTGNVLLKCSATEKAAADDNGEKIIIRMFGHQMSFHRDSEVFIMRKLSENNIIPPIYCR